MKPVLTLAAVLLLASGCDDFDGTKRAHRDQVEAAEAAWDGPCADKAWLLASTAGSPDTAQCPNKRHRMRVQAATVAANEEIGALVFCECQREREAQDAGE